MNNDIIISIVIPFYNTDLDVFANCLDSCLASSFNKYEIIIVDDGSDNPFCVSLEAIAAKDSRIRLIRQENKGVSAARNRGVAETKGQFITFIDSDDIISKDFLLIAYQIATKYNADMVIGQVKSISDKADILNDVKYTDIIVEEFSDNILSLKARMITLDNAIQNTEGYFSRGSVARLIRRELVNQVQFCEDVQIGEDIIWNLQLLEKSRKICLIQQVCYYYYKHQQSVTHKYDTQIINKLDLQLTKIAELVDFSESDEYLAYVRHIRENIHLIWNNYLSYCKDSSSKHKNSIWRLYHDSPWTMIAEKRYFQLANNNERIYSLLYRLKFLFLVMRLRKKNG